MGEIGSKVVFKRPKRAKVVWTVKEVEVDADKVNFTSGGQTPNYIKLEGMVPDRSGHLVKTTLWTCENKLRLLLEPK